jgi:hypothetical protein
VSSVRDWIVYVVVEVGVTVVENVVPLPATEVPSDKIKVQEPVAVMVPDIVADPPLQIVIGGLVIIPVGPTKCLGVFPIPSPFAPKKINMAKHTFAKSKRILLPILLCGVKYVVLRVSRGCFFNPIFLQMQSMVLDSYSLTRVHDNEQSIFIKIESKASKKQDSDRNRSDLFHRNW